MFQQTPAEGDHRGDAPLRQRHRVHVHRPRRRDWQRSEQRRHVRNGRGQQPQHDVPAVAPSNTGGVARRRPEQRLFHLQRQHHPDTTPSRPHRAFRYPLPMQHAHIALDQHTTAPWRSSPWCTTPAPSVSTTVCGPAPDNRRLFLTGVKLGLPFLYVQTNTPATTATTARRNNLPGPGARRTGETPALPPAPTPSSASRRPYANVTGSTSTVHVGGIGSDPSSDGMSVAGEGSMRSTTCQR